MSTLPEECAGEVLDVALLLIHTVYTEVKSHQTPDLSMSQFRALAFLKWRSGASLSDVADHIGITSPSTSKLIDRLVERNLVVRHVSTADRRYITLALTSQGMSVLESSRQGVQSTIAEMLAALSEAERASIVQGAQILRSVFTQSEL